MNDSATMLRVAYRRGFYAYNGWGDQDINPYSKSLDLDLWGAWNRGWEDAEFADLDESEPDWG